MVAVYDRESPWGESDILDPLMVDWMDARDDLWECDLDGDPVVIGFVDRKVAMLFKLMWT